MFPSSSCIQVPRYVLSHSSLVRTERNQPLGHATDSGLDLKQISISGESIEPGWGWDNRLLFVMKGYYWAVSVNELWYVSTLTTYVIPKPLFKAESMLIQTPANHVSRTATEHLETEFAFQRDLADGKINHLDVTIPMGLREIIEKLKGYSDITPENIVRSSLFVKENNLWDTLGHID
ncbi:hypothetical protein P154DRAFT_581882 [Amniculicola lignicola CBS 123094]|uniref:Uncharacterized protein n=1 Tax=Amniculicola lignicola CBS 123094 TaxID=1392246 RepID=A0A6A5W074_9PLEO|nr:hypothetical protein P154DRAFT_581882 [Amniculicola lignicola CBS 123094]